jgi:hypothetical protein
MIKLIDLLKEAKQVGILYHYTSLHNLQSIIKSNKLQSRESSGVSFSRSKDKNIMQWLDTTVEAALVINGDKLSNNYKIYPYNDLATQDSVGVENFDEMEEVVDRDITNLDKYLIKVILYESDPDIESLLKEKNIPYNINIENIPKNYTIDGMYFPGMETTTIELRDQWGPKKIKVGVSSQYPDYYLEPSFLSWKDYTHYFNKNKEEINIKFIPIPMYNDPKWRKMWNNVQYPYSGFREDNVFNSYILIPKNEI